MLTEGQIEEIPAQDGATVLEFFPSARAAAIAEYLDPDTAARIVAVPWVSGWSRVVSQVSGWAVTVTPMNATTNRTKKAT